MMPSGRSSSVYSDYAGRPLAVNQPVYKSEAETNQRNQAISMLMFAYGHIKENPLQACDIYTKQCAVNVNAKDLAMMAATLANGGKNPVTGQVSYLEFLKAGGSLPPIEALKRAGVDMTRPEPVDRAFGVLAEYVDAFEALVGK